MKLFETAINNFIFLGLKWHKSAKKYIFSKKQIVLSSLSIPCVIGVICFLIYEAKTFFDYTLTFMILSTAILCLIVNVFLKINVDSLNDWFEIINKVVKQSKWQILLI